MHGAQVPADLCTDAGQVSGWSEPQQSAPRVDRVCELKLNFFEFFWGKSLSKHRYSMCKACSLRGRRGLIVTGYAVHYLLIQF